MSATQPMPSLGFSAPALVRKVDRPTFWRPTKGEGAPTIEQRLGNVFPRDDNGTVSVYLVSNYQDLQRVSLAYNSTRLNLTEEIQWLPLSLAEVQAEGIEIKTDLAETVCGFANRLHRSLIHDEEKFRRLTQRLVSEDRELRKFRRGELKSAITKGEGDGCAVTRDDHDGSGCECASPAASSAK